MWPGIVGPTAAVKIVAGGRRGYGLSSGGAYGRGWGSGEWAPGFFILRIYKVVALSVINYLKENGGGVLVWIVDNKRKKWS